MEKEVGHAWLPVDRTNTWNILLITHSFRQKSVSDFPGEHCWVFSLVFTDGPDHFRGGHLGFRSADDPRAD